MYRKLNVYDVYGYDNSSDFIYEQIANELLETKMFIKIMMNPFSLISYCYFRI